ncbi:hypothetical protein SCJ96_11310 [Legionella pneumophila serogroup 1]|uniref:hypothetical protein n=1 Tax=Legionella pneumophila TaxID=446 RepID=UPI001A28CBA8|nr:hypothetical protein [Legionella pneumophila]HAT8823344.1 hypothetical protein [Legionella pneumophila subsp. pneumophila]MCH9067484.1 hypothetical protein [Legionella pneumophila serogroup 1]MDW8969972.1 hypothetical protein [Legionella pneumophila]HAT1764868.1 hypothetical protein [Legionella pneumophila]HAU0672521.1 hypothetical protein [Legionella pneumophila]
MKLYTKKDIIKILDDSVYIFEKCLKRELQYSPLKSDFEKANKELIPIIKQVKEDIEHLSVDKLERVGLWGDQLTLKIKGFENAFKSWSSNGTKKALLKLLKWLNTILGSLSIIIPHCEPIKEYKECIENDLSD